MDETQRAQIVALRSQGLPTKTIARRLGLRPAEAAAIVYELLAQQERDANPAILPAIHACYLSPGFTTGLGFPQAAEGWRACDPGFGGSEGLVQALWARTDRYDRLTVCGALLDVYCLGVKNAFGPNKLQAHELRSFVSHYFSSYEAPPIEVPFELVQSLVFGAIDYAASLGFEPYADFALVRASLGPWNGPSPIEFGKNGRPFFMQGPDDDVYRIVQTLRRTVGDGGFDFVTGGQASPFHLP